MTQRSSFIGIFSYLDDVLSALQAAEKANVKVHTVFSPIPRHEISEALGLKSSPVRYFTLFGGLLGAGAGFGLAAYTALQWNLIVGGKPILAWIPFVVVGFEFTILLGVLATILGLLIYCQLPKVRIADHYDPRFTCDKFGILVHCPPAELETITKLLKEAGAEELHEIKR